MYGYKYVWMYGCVYEFATQEVVGDPHYARVQIVVWGDFIHVSIYASSWLVKSS